MALPTVVKQLLGSEKALASGFLLIAATIFAALGRIDAVQWMDYTQVILGIYVGGKAIQGAAATLADRRPPQRPD